MKKALLVIVVFVIAVAGYLAYLSNESAQSVDVPVITVTDILHASDFEQGIKKAVRQNDLKEVESWMDKALNVARQAGLPEADLIYLKSDRALDYAKFKARRALFNDAFEERFYNLKGIDDLKNKYPQAQDLFADAEKLIEKRDSIVQSIARTLSGAQEPTEEDIAKAKALWRERYKEQTDAANDSAIAQ